MLNFYLLKLQDPGLDFQGYEYYRGFVVAAPTETAARELARDLSDNTDWSREEPTSWTNPEHSSCELVGTAAPNLMTGIVLTQDRQT